MNKYYLSLNDIGTDNQHATGFPFCNAGKNCVFITASPADLLNISESVFSTKYRFTDPFLLTRTLKTTLPSRPAFLPIQDIQVYSLFENYLHMVVYLQK